MNSSGDALGFAYRSSHLAGRRLTAANGQSESRQAAGLVDARSGAPSLSVYAFRSHASLATAPVGEGRRDIRSDRRFSLHP